jgi:hypothetical protein
MTCSRRIGRFHSNPVPTEPMRDWRTTWRKMRAAIACPACGMCQQPSETCVTRACGADIRGLTSSTANFRFHDLWHNAITDLVSNTAVSEHTAMSIAGHISREMMECLSLAKIQNAFEMKIIGESCNIVTRPIYWPCGVLANDWLKKPASVRK